MDAKNTANPVYRALQQSNCMLCSVPAPNTLLYEKFYNVYVTGKVLVLVFWYFYPVGMHLKLR